MDTTKKAPVFIELPESFDFSATYESAETQGTAFGISPEREDEIMTILQQVNDEQPDEGAMITEFLKIAYERLQLKTAVEVFFFSYCFAKITTLMKREEAMAEFLGKVLSGGK